MRNHQKIITHGANLRLIFISIRVTKISGCLHTSLSLPQASTWPESRGSSITGPHSAVVPVPTINKTIPARCSRIFSNFSTGKCPAREISYRVTGTRVFANLTLFFVLFTTSWNCSAVTIRAAGLEYPRKDPRLSSPAISIA